MSRRWGLLFAALSVLILPAGAQEEIPYGEAIVATNEAGAIDLLGRCVPAQELLTQLAARAGATAEFPKPVLARVSFVTVNPSRTVEQWVSEICGELNLKREIQGGTWRFTRAFPEFLGQYDPTLTEEEIRAKFQATEEPKPPATGGISGAVLVLNGRYIPAPYEVTVREITPYRCEVLVNGVVAGIHGHPEPEGPLELPDPLPEEYQFSDFDMLWKYVYRDLYPPLLEAMGSDKALEAAAEYLRTQHILADAKVVEEGGIEKVGEEFIEMPYRRRLIVQRKGMEGEWPIFPENYDPLTGELMGLSNAVPVRRHADQAAQELRMQLARTNLLLLGLRGPEIEMHSGERIDRFLELVLASENMTLLDAECMFCEFTRDRDVARDMVTNIGYERASLVDSLVKLVASR